MKRAKCILSSLVYGVSNSLGYVRSQGSCFGVHTIAASNLFRDRLHNVLSVELAFLLSFIPFPSKRWLALPLHPHNYFFSYNKTVQTTFFRTSPAIPSILGNRARRMSFFSRKKHPSASQLAASNVTVTVAQTPSQALAQLAAKEAPQQSNDA